MFIALAPDIESARKLVEEAETEAAEIVVQARDQASALLARAQRDSRSARAEAAARVVRDTTDHDRAMLADARNEAEALARSGTALLPEMTRIVLDQMRAELRQP